MNTATLATPVPPQAATAPAALLPQAAPPVPQAAPPAPQAAPPAPQAAPPVPQAAAPAPQAAAPAPPTAVEPPAAAPYRDNWEHLQDELAWLDRLLHLRLLERRANGQPDALEPFRGLVISEPEVLHLLALSGAAAAAPAAASTPHAAATAAAPPPPAPPPSPALTGSGPRGAGRSWLPSWRKDASSPAVAAPRPGVAPTAAPLAAATAGAQPPAPSSEREQALAALIALGDQIAARRAAGAGELRLARLSWLFHLSAFEERCVLLCLAPEVDRRYERLFAFLQDDITARTPTVGLLLSLLCGSGAAAAAARSIFAPQAPLARTRLLRIGDERPAAGAAATLLARPLKLDDRIVEFLFGSDALPALPRSAAAHVVTPAAPGDDEPDAAFRATHRQLVELIRSRLSGAAASDGAQTATAAPAPATPPPSVFYLRGPYGAGKRKLARAVCADLGLALVEADLGRAAAAAPDAAADVEIADAVELLAREAVLQPAALSLANSDRLFATAATAAASAGPGAAERSPAGEALGEAVRLFSRVTFLLGEQPWNAAAARLFAGPGAAAGDDDDGTPPVTEIVLDLPDLPTARALWQRELARLAPAATTTDGTLAPAAAFPAAAPGALASRFRFSPGQIRDAAAHATALAALRAPQPAPDPSATATATAAVTAADLNAACRAQTDGRLSQVAKKVVARARWTELVLPADPLAQLKEICDQARFRHVVLGDWGFAERLSLGRGLNVLFSGPPGTGKTMAAEVIANELDLDLYKIDLSQMVSKYIGETEKNLDRVFAAAWSASAILFFDEADALFGKRSEVRDSHDRYANIEISYLLQKMEEFEGIAILATNLRQNLDDAFQRRLAFTVHFPFPDEESRRRIWAGAWPPATPLAAEVDPSVLARRFKLSGGNIKNVALGAAFLAAAESSAVGYPHLLRAVRRELQKLGKTPTDAEVTLP